MKIARSTIALRQLRFHARHGVLPQERVTGGDYLVSVCVECDFARALETDNVDDTLNYARLYELVKREMDVPSNLIEHVAGRIGERLFAEFPDVAGATIELTKLNPPMGGVCCAGAAVELHLTNDRKHS